MPFNYTAHAFPYNPEHPPRAYLQQLLRARRFLDRYRLLVFARPGGPRADYYDIDDMLWAFFQNCWHVKDWLRHDPIEPEDKIAAAVKAAEAHFDLLVIADLANGSKHFLETGRRAGARDSGYQMVDGPGGTSGFMPLIEVANGRESLALDVALRGLVAWRSVLSSAGLHHFAPPD